MALRPSDYEYIRRLGDEPTEEEAIALRVLRRQANDPSDIRLLDSLLTGANRRQAATRQRTALENRLAHLEQRQSPEGKAQTAALRKQERKRLAQTFIRDLRLGGFESEERAAAVTAERWRKEDDAAAAELKVLQAQLKESA